MHVADRSPGVHISEHDELLPDPSKVYDLDLIMFGEFVEMELRKLGSAFDAFAEQLGLPNDRRVVGIAGIFAGQAALFAKGYGCDRDAYLHLCGLMFDVTTAVHNDPAEFARRLDLVKRRGRS